MKIIIVGVACVGKSTLGEILACKLGYKFFDFDFEIEKYFNSHITYLKIEYPNEPTFREKASVVLRKILKENDDNFVIAMPPSGLMDNYWKVIKEDESIITIALRDRAKNIVKRLIFYDDDSKLIEYAVTEKNEKYYLKEISMDIEYFGRTYIKAKIKKNVDGKSASQLADELKELLLHDA